MAEPLEKFIAPVAPTPSERTCLMVGSLGIACTTCELVRSGECDVRKAGALIEDLERSNAEKSVDDVIPDFLTMQGMRDEVRKNEELAKLLTARKIGAELADIRGVHATNETWGRRSGDSLLIASAGRLVVRRSANGGSHPRRRRVGSPTIPDFGFRGTKADELGVLRPGTNLGTLKAIVARTSEAFSPDQAIRDSRRGKIPIIASVSYAHASEVDLPDTATPLEIFDGMTRLMLDRHDPLKAVQYNELWRHVLSTLKLGQTTPEKPKDPRLIVEAFWERCCTGFYDQAQERFSQP